MTQLWLCIKWFFFLIYYIIFSCITLIISMYYTNICITIIIWTYYTNSGTVLLLRKYNIMLNYYTKYVDVLHHMSQYYTNYIDVLHEISHNSVDILNHFCRCITTVCRGVTSIILMRCYNYVDLFFHLCRLLGQLCRFTMIIMSMYYTKQCR